MTNEEKDRQEKESFKKFYNKGLELGKSIAKQQFKEYLEKMKLACEMNAKHVFGYDMGGAYDLELKAHFCDEIINELFPNN